MSLLLHINLSSEQHLTAVPSVACYRYYKCCLQAQNKMLNTTVQNRETYLVNTLQEDRKVQQKLMQVHANRNRSIAVAASLLLECRKASANF